MLRGVWLRAWGLGLRFMGFLGLRVRLRDLGLSLNPTPLHFGAQNLGAFRA